jgi:hypothetical protein
MGKILLLLILLLIPAGACADMPVWVTAEGESHQGEMDTPREVRERALRNAENKAVEEAVGTFIKSHTLVSNSQVAEDLIYAAVRGKISRKEIVSSDWDAKARYLYRVRIKALVEPVYPEKGEGLVARLSLSRTDLKEGDEVQIFYQVSRDAYVYIFSIAADGSVTLLFPNTGTPDPFTRAGKPHTFPPEKGPVRLKALFLPDCKEAAVEERIKIIATRQKEDLLPLGFREGIFQVYDARSTGMISDLVRRLARIEPTDWAEATSTYTLRR